jgi:hypothetical protein
MGSKPAHPAKASGSTPRVAKGPGVLSAPTTPQPHGAASPRATGGRLLSRRGAAVCSTGLLGGASPASHEVCARALLGLPRARSFPLPEA